MTRKHKNYTVDEVLKSLRNKQVKINEGGRIIEYNTNPAKAPFDIGNGSKGKFDFLRKYCGWSIVAGYW